MVRAYGSVAAVAAAVLAIIIGVIAFNVSSDDQPSRPPQGGQAGAPQHSSGIESLFNTASEDLERGKLEPVVEAPPPPANNNARVTATFSGGGGGGAPAPVARSCNPGIVASLLAGLGGLLGGSGSAC